MPPPLSRCRAETMQTAERIVVDPGWAGSFRYDYYRSLLSAVKERFPIRLFRDARDLSSWHHSGALLRHDIDIALPPAVRMAELEHDAGVCSTYMVMVRSVLYDVSRRESSDMLAEIIAMGHEVGVHFDCPESFRGDANEVTVLESLISDDCRRLEDILGIAVDSVSFHRPVPWLLRGPLLIGGRVNAYAELLMGWYLSDSKGRWRDGEPLTRLTRPESPILQLLTHPIWWGENHQAPRDRLESFFVAQSQRMEPAETIVFDRLLEQTVPGIRRAGIPPSE